MNPIKFFLSSLACVAACGAHAQAAAPQPVSGAKRIVLLVDEVRAIHEAQGAATVFADLTTVEG